MTVRPEHREQETLESRGVVMPAMIVPVPGMIVPVPVIVVPVMLVLSLIRVTAPRPVLMVIALLRRAICRSRRGMLVGV